MSTNEFEIEFDNKPKELAVEFNGEINKFEIEGPDKNNHSHLNNLDYENSGHIGFASSKDIEEINNKLSDCVQDPNYIHTDNNYTDEDKEKLENLENIEVNGKDIPFEDNYGYGTPDNIQDALDFAFEELDNRILYEDLDNCVSFGYKQNKTAAQKDRARENMGISETCVFHHKTQNLSEVSKRIARNNIEALGIIDLGEIDLYDKYDGDIRNFLNTITSTGLYTFFDVGDEFNWFVEVYKLKNGSIGQSYWGQEEGYAFKNYRSGCYYEDSKFFDVFDEWRNLTNSQADALFAPKTHSHSYSISTSKDIRDYLTSYTNYSNKDLRVISSTTKHVYIVKLEFTYYSTPDGMRYVRYQEYYDIEEPNKIYKRIGTSKTATIPSVIWEDWCEFNSDTHVLETNEQQEGAELGEELVNATNWIIDGWTGNLSEGFTHVSGNANPLTFEMPEETEENYYIIEFETNISLNDADLAVSIGNDIGALMYGQRTPIRLGIKSTSNGNLLFTPSTTWTGKIFNISIKKIIADSESILNVTDTTGANSFEIRPTIAQQKNIFIGIDSGKKNISGYESVSLGESALKENMSGFWNTAVGKSALENNISGSRNIAIGYVALQDNISGLRNVGIGTFALHSNKTGSRNIAIGADSLDKNIEGSKNIAIGVQSLYRNIKGIDNTAIGDGAVGSLTEGSRNVGVGTNALSGVTTGEGNLGVGYGCLANVGTGSNNVGIGINSLYKLQNGSNNVGIGNNAGRGNTNASHSNLVAIGTSTGSGLTKGTYYNVFIGGLAGQNVTTGSFNIIIGGQVNADSPTENYQLNIGNLIKGSMKEGSRYAEINGGLQVNELPTSDPKIAGRIWNDNGTLKISSGT